MIRCMKFVPTGLTYVETDCLNYSRYSETLDGMFLVNNSFDLCNPGIMISAHSHMGARFTH